MALSVPKAPGVAQMLKDGARILSGLEEAVNSNLTACKEFAQTAKLLVLANQQQEIEIGDGTNFVVVFAGALLEGAEELLRLGITTTEIADSYEIALSKAIEELETLVIGNVDTDDEKMKAVIRTSVQSKQFGQEDFITDLIFKACKSVWSGGNSFNVDNIRICKIPGSSLMKSEVVNGMVFKRFVEGDVSSARNAKIAVYSCPVDILQTETKGTVLIKPANELKDPLFGFILGALRN